MLSPDVEVFAFIRSTSEVPQSSEQSIESVSYRSHRLLAKGVQVEDQGGRIEREIICESKRDTRT